MKKILKTVMSVVIALTMVSGCGAAFINVCAAAAVEDVWLDLSSKYTRDIVNRAGTTSATASIMNAVFSYDGDLIEQAYNENGRLASATAEFELGSYADGAYNCIDLATATTISIPKGVYSSVNFLAGSPLNNVDYSILLNFTDGTSSNVGVSIQDWGITTNAVFSANSRIKMISNADGTYSYISVSPVNEAIHEYSLPVPAGKIVSSIEFPQRPNFFIMAITAVQKKASDSTVFAQGLISTLQAKANPSKAEIENALYFAMDAQNKGGIIENINALYAMQENLHTGTVVDLSTYYNMDIVGNVGVSANIAGVIAGGNQAFDAALLENAFPGGTGTIGDLSYSFGSLDGAASNSVYCGSGAVTISLPNGVYSGLSAITAGAATGDINATLNYSDGTTSQANFHVQEWTSTDNSIFSTTTRIKTTQSGETFTGVSVAVSSALTESSVKTQSGKILTSVTFPSQKVMRLLALTAINCSKAETDAGASIAISNMEAGIKARDVAAQFVSYAEENDFTLSDASVYNEKLNSVNTYSCIDLSDVYNTDFYLSTGEIDTTSNEFFYSVWAYDEDLLAQQLYNNEIVCGNVGFQLGQFKAQQNSGVNLKLNAANVTLGSRIYNKIHVLMASKEVNRGKDYSITINYCDGTSEQATIALIESFDGMDAGAGILAASSARVRSTDGYSHTNGFMAANMYAYSITPTACKAIESISFPKNDWLGLFAVTAENYSENQLAAKADLWLQNESITYDAAGASITAEVKPYTDNSSICAIAAVYDNGVLTDASYCTVTPQNGILMIEKNVGGAAEGSVKLIVWESINSMKPISRMCK